MNKQFDDPLFDETTPNNSDVSVISYPAEKETIEYAIELVKQNVNKFNDWRTKEVGLNLALFGLAEKQAERLSKIAPLVMELEELVFDSDKLRNFSPVQVLEIYKLAVQAQKESADYIKTSIKSIDWAGVEAQLLACAADEAIDVSNDKNVRLIAQQLMSRINMNNESSHEPRSG